VLNGATKVARHAISTALRLRIHPTSGQLGLKLNENAAYGQAAVYRAEVAVITSPHRKQCGNQPNPNREAAVEQSLSILWATPENCGLYVQFPPLGAGGCVDHCRSGTAVERAEAQRRHKDPIERLA